MKKFLSVILAVFIFVLFAPTAFAQGEFIVDDADLLTDDMEFTLASQISSVQAQYGIDVVIHTTMSIGYEDIHSYAENFYLSNGYAEDGLVFVINLNNNEVGNRDFYTYYQGAVYDTFGNEAYDSDYGTVNSAVLPYLSGEDYYSAFTEYLRLTEGYLSGEITYSDDGYYDDDYDDNYYDSDYYYDSTPSNSGYFIKELIVIAVAAIVAFIVVSVMKSKMNTAVIKNEASDYVKAGSMNVTKRLDVFTHRHITKTAKPKNNSSSGSRSGGGFSGGGGGRSGGGGGKF
ncbi:MAG: TPM domain-containing protein [Ruminococcaceae bacterium]|nr:TPM domain-containing protein [Oscillospiraceae bacterium]